MFSTTSTTRSSYATCWMGCSPSSYSMSLSLHLESSQPETPSVSPLSTKAGTPNALAQCISHQSLKLFTANATRSSHSLLGTSTTAWTNPQPDTTNHPGGTVMQMVQTPLYPPTKQISLSFASLWRRPYGNG